MMEKILLVAFILSECFILAHSLSGRYYFVNKNLSWTEAQTYCRNWFTDLATVGNDEELNHLLNNVSSAGYNSDFWIGLYTEINWKWSDGNTGNYTDWDTHSGEPDFYRNQFCVSNRKNKGGHDTHCSVDFPFICYSKKPYIMFEFVNETTTWSDAQSYCRKNYDDLAPARLASDIETIHHLTPGSTYAWIGLFRDPDLYWSDGSSYDFGDIPGPNLIGSLKVMCGFTSLGSPGTWTFSGCDTKLPFMCYGPPCPIKRVVKLRLSMDESVDLNNSAVQEKLLTKLQDRLKENGVTGVSLTWRNQQDGQVFYKEKKDE